MAAFDYEFLKRDLRWLLEAHPDGISEHALLGELRKLGRAPFPDDFSGSNYALYRAHFLLFHALYRLQGELLQTHSGQLEINPLKIVVRAYEPGTAGLAERDPLRDYYLDLDNMARTTADDVDAMLENFWIRYLKPDERREALKELGLRDPVDSAIIRKRYRELAMRHHPDRGGDAERLQAIHEAMRILAPKARDTRR